MVRRRHLKFCGGINNKSPCHLQKLCTPLYLRAEKHIGGAATAGRRICAGYYRRYDGKVVYVVSLATDANTGEETVV